MLKTDKFETLYTLNSESAPINFNKYISKSQRGNDVQMCDDSDEHMGYLSVRDVKGCKKASKRIMENRQNFLLQK